jgi:hypothetical protein
MLAAIAAIVFSVVSAQAQYFTFERISDSIVVGSANELIHSYYRFNNLTASPITVHFSGSDLIVPSGWDTAGICTWQFCHAPGDFNFDEVVGPGLQDTAATYVYFYTGTQPGFSRVRVTISYLTQSVSHYFSAGVQPFGIKQISSVVRDFELAQNYPNPFNPTTRISFAIPRKDFVYLRIYDILGREVKTLISEELEPGEYEYEFDSEGLSSGFYYYSLRAGEYVAVKKMVLVK